MVFGLKINDKQGCLAKLEKDIIKHYKQNGKMVDYGNASSGMISQRETINMGMSKGRNHKKDGFYLFTINEGNESHGIIIEKLTVDQKVKFLLFDPNGKAWANRLKKGMHRDKKDRGGYSLDIRYDRNIYELDKEHTPTRAWNSSGECYLWNIVMIVLFMEKYDSLCQIEECLSYKYPKKEYNTYKNNSVSTHGDVFIIQLAYDVYLNKKIYANSVERFIELVVLSINVFLRTPYMLDFEDIKQTVYTREMLDKLKRKDLVTICKTRMFKNYNCLDRESLIGNIIDSENEKNIAVCV